MLLSVRPLRPGEARRYLEIHRAALRGIASNDYPARVIDAWAPVPIADADVQAIEDDQTEIRLIAELDGEPVGMGAFVPQHSESPAMSRRRRRGKASAARS